MGQRRRAREYALQILFEIDLAGGEPSAVISGFWEANPASEEIARPFAEWLVQGVHEQRREIDRLIVGAASNWRIERMAAVDRNVLRLAVFELLHDRETPPAVVIDEAIEIGKRFGSEDSGSFVNGILDSIHRRLEAREAPSPSSGES